MLLFITLDPSLALGSHMYSGLMPLLTMRALQWLSRVYPTFLLHELLMWMLFDFINSSIYHLDFITSTNIDSPLLTDIYQS